MRSTGGVDRCLQPVKVGCLEIGVAAGATPGATVVVGATVVPGPDVVGCSQAVDGMSTVKRPMAPSTPP
jgi:hypothetical protein